MAVRDLYSHRKRVTEGDMPDVYVYDKLPSHLRVQIGKIWDDAIGEGNRRGWKVIHDIVAREHGVERLRELNDVRSRCVTYLKGSRWLDGVLDLIETSFDYIDKDARDLPIQARAEYRVRITPDAAIEELNERFKRAGVGYRFESGKIIRIDSELVHAKIVKPALEYLHQPGFDGPRAEYLSAHAHYRAGETKDAVVDANNAFESTLKLICEDHGWECPSGATASSLVKVVKRNGLLPDYLETSFEQLAATLQSGLPKVRGEEGAHGHGSVPRQTPDYVAAYALHLAAANILFLVEAERAMG